MSNSKKHVLSIVKSKKVLNGKEYPYYTLLCDGDFRTSAWCETFIILYVINLYIENDCYMLDNTLSCIFGHVVDVCNGGLKALPYNE